MKINVSRNARRLAGSLLVTLCICGIMASTVIGYLVLVRQQNVLSTRSQTWNLAMTMAEAGIEEGLQHLNTNYKQLDVDSWTYQGDGKYSITRQFANGDGYTVLINGSDLSQPTIMARAYVEPPELAQLRSHLFFATVGVNVQNPTAISRAVRVLCYKGGLFTKAMVAKEGVEMNGNNVMTDSFDSQDDQYSTDGLYDGTKAKSGGDVASNQSIQNAVDVGNANIYGRVSTGPNGTVAIGSQGKVGDREWLAAHPEADFQPGWITDTSNFTFPETELPNTAGYSTPRSGYITNYISPDSYSTNTTLYPDPPPLGVVVTNTSYVTTSIMPDPPPPGLTNVVTTVTTSTLPNPVPSGVVVTNTTSTISKNYPAPGTYIGEVIPLNGNKYMYQRITGYTYTVTTYRYPTYQYVFTVSPTNTLPVVEYYDNILDSGNYVASSLSGNTIILGDATLVLPNGLQMSGGDTIRIANGGKATVYAGGTTVSVSGNGIINEGGLAGDFILYCAATVTSFALSGNGQFTGVVVAPSADVSLNGSGNDTVDFIGSLMANSIRLNGHFNFHYDEALGRLFNNGRYLILSWDEVE